MVKVTMEMVLDGAQLSQVSALLAEFGVEVRLKMLPVGKGEGSAGISVPAADCTETQKPAETVETPLVTLECELCGLRFQAKTRRKKLCDSCTELRKRESTKAANQKYRQAKEEARYEGEETQV